MLRITLVREFGRVSVAVNLWGPRGDRMAQITCLSMGLLFMGNSNRPWVDWGTYLAFTPCHRGSRIDPVLFLVP